MVVSQESNNARIGNAKSVQVGLVREYSLSILEVDHCGIGVNESTHSKGCHYSPDFVTFNLLKFGGMIENRKWICSEIHPPYTQAI
jgi:hypothetical protein